MDELELTDMGRERYTREYLIESLQELAARLGHTPTYRETDGLWTVPPCGRLTAALKAWTTRGVAHAAHSLDGEAGTFSAVKWVLFQLSRFRQNSSSGSVFDCQMGTFSLDNNIALHPPLRPYHSCQRGRKRRD